MTFCKPVFSSRYTLAPMVKFACGKESYRGLLSFRWLEVSIQSRQAPSHAGAQRILEAAHSREAVTPELVPR